MQDDLVPVWAGGDDWKDQIGEVTKFNPRTGTLTIQITDPEVVQELVDGQRIALGLTLREVPRHEHRRQP
jgi:hypothetical protein